MAPNEHQPAEPNLADIARNSLPIEPTPKRRQERKRKTTNPSQGVRRGASQGLKLRPLAKRPTLVPKQRSHVFGGSSATNTANLFWYSANPETQRASQIQQTTAPIRTTPSLGEGYGGSGYLPIGNVTRASNGSVGGEAGLNHLAPYALGMPSQDPDLGHVGAPSSISSVQRLAKSPWGQPLEQQWTDNTGPSSAACPWHFHLEGIMSLGLGISQISRKLKSATIEVDVEALLEKSESLLQSYFKLKEYAQQSMPPSGRGLRSG